MLSYITIPVIDKINIMIGYRDITDKSIHDLLDKLSFTIYTINAKHELI